MAIKSPPSINHYHQKSVTERHVADRVEGLIGDANKGAPNAIEMKTWETAELETCEKDLE